GEALELSHETLPVHGDLLVRGVLGEPPQGCDSGRARHDRGVERAGVIDGSGAEAFHQLLAPGQSGNGPPARHRLAIGSEIGSHAVPLGRSTRRYPEAGYDLIEDQDGAVIVT